MASTRIPVNVAKYAEGEVLVTISANMNANATQTNDATAELAMQRPDRCRFEKTLSNRRVHSRDQVRAHSDGSIATSLAPKLAENSDRTMRCSEANTPQTLLVQAIARAT